MRGWTVAEESRADGADDGGDICFCFIIKLSVYICFIRLFCGKYLILSIYEEDHND